MSNQEVSTISAIDQPDPDQKEAKFDPDFLDESRTGAVGVEAVVTPKTWLAIFLMSLSFGCTFWPVPTLGGMQSELAVRLGDPLAMPWFTPSYTVAIAVSFLICGGNSDLFGRRWLIIGGNVIALVGHIVAATANNTSQLIAAIAIVGFGGGCVQCSTFAIPELLPNKWRHIGVCMADGVNFFVVIVGPIVGRYSIDVAGGSAWRWIYIGGAIGQGVSGFGLFFLYFPPAHPRGVPFWDAVRGMDWIGMALFTPAMTITLAGIINTTYIPASNVRCVALLCVGFALLVIFALWEQFGNIKYPLCPTHIFLRNHGRSFTWPFINATILGMVYYAINIIYPTCINIFYVGPTTPLSKQLALTLPGNLGLAFGALLLVTFGGRIRHFRWTLVISVTGVTLFSGLVALVTPDNRSLIIALTFLEQTCYGWADYLAVVFVQQGVPQLELGIAGALGGVTRYAGGSLAQAIYTTVLANTEASKAAQLIPRAALGAGLPESSLTSFLAAFPANTTALAGIKGVDNAILAAAGAAYKESYAHGLMILAFVSIAFGVVSMVAALLCEDIDAKMNDKIEVFLENDRLADMNKFH